MPVAAALLLAGCVQTPPDLAPLVQIAPSSCAAAPDLGRALPVAYKGEEKAEPVTVTITEQSPCLAEGEMKSLYEVFALPSVSHSIIVTVRSLPSTSGILAPRIVTLDADGNRVRQVDRESIHFRGRALTAMLRTRPEERYVVVTSDTEVVGGDVSRVSGAVHQQMISSGAFMVAVYSGSESVANMTYAHNGTVEVSARPIPVAK
jgi:hypothetical protein